MTNKIKDSESDPLINLIEYLVYFLVLESNLYPIYFITFYLFRLSFGYSNPIS